MNKRNTNINELRIGVTGGTGGLGNKLINLLLKEGAEITCFVRKTSSTKDIEDMVTLCYGSLTDMASVEKFISNVDVCIHLAAQVSPTTAENYYLSNVVGTENICKSIVKLNPHCRLINCSSIAAYRIKGICKMQFTDYAKSKLAADNIVDYYIKEKGLKATTVIPGMIYGPGKNVFIPTVIENLKNNKLFLVKGGEEFAPLSYIDDLCDLFIKVVKNEESVGQKYFGINYTEKGIHDFIKLIASKISYSAPSKVYNKKVLMFKAITLKLIYSFFNFRGHPKLSIRMVDVLSINYQLTLEQRTNNIGWIPTVSMETGIDIVLSQYDLTQKQKNDKLITM